MEQEQGVHTSALIATCVLCSCPSITEPHLAISLSYSELRSENAVAISYTWGAFDRRDVCIGHCLRQPTVRLFLNLGQEWDVPELLQRLSELSRDYKAIWIDQLCMSQNTADIQLNLARVPAIYSTLNVIAILPGSPPCCCFREHVQERRANVYRSSYSWSPDLDEASKRIMNGVADHETEQERQMDSVRHQVDSVRDNFSWQLGVDEVSDEITDEDDIRAAHDRNELTCLTDCQNAISICSWLDRIWTRQEFAYSNHISIVWNSKAELPCTNVGFRESRNLAINPFYQLTTFNLRRQLSEYPWLNSDEDLDIAVSSRLDDTNRDFFTTGRAAVDRYTQTDDPGLLFAEFLLGKSLESKHTSKVPLEKFLLDLCNLSISTRTATKPCDFVLAVWCDCPGYIIPMDYREAKPFDLLDDAIKQLEQNYSLTLLTTCPSGLFDDSGPSVPWRSLAVPQSSVLASAKDMYAVFMVRPDYGILPLVEGAVPLRMIEESPGSIGRRAGDYELLCGDMTTAQALCIMGRAVVNFDQHARSLVSSEGLMVSEVNMKEIELSLSLNADYQKSATPRVFDQSFLEENADALAFHFEEVLSWEAGKTEQDARIAEDWRAYPELDHGTLIYKIVARVLQLDYDMCRSHGLRLMIAIDDPVRIGLFRDQHNTHSPNSGDTELDQGISDDTIYAARFELTNTITVWNFEAQRIFNDEADQSTKYRVIGVWVPCHEEVWEEVGAEPVTDEGEIDAWLL
ncbi:hypothetical protein LTS08_008846 [Lithohypha guttulata]|nr:hypothetical protein LTS08_008846 [Lithohypha guttulata]